MDTIIRLENGQRLVVIDKIIHNKERYLFLSDYDDLEMIFAKMTGEDTIERVTDEELIFELMKHVATHIKENPNFEKIAKETLKNQ